MDQNQKPFKLWSFNGEFQLIKETNESDKQGNELGINQIERLNLSNVDPFIKERAVALFKTIGSQKELKGLQGLKNH